jgi:DNA repair protein RadA/Sms
MVRPKGPGSPRVAGPSAFGGSCGGDVRGSRYAHPVGKIRVALSCGACGHQVGQWVGRCPSCGAWGTVAEQSAASNGAAPVPLTVAGETEARLSTGLAGVNRVLGGGLVTASVVLIAGEPGIGKSTLLLHVLANLSAAGHDCLLASGEESRGQIAARSSRLGLPGSAGSFVSGRELPVVLEAARSARPAVLVVDSIQAIRDPETAGLPGGPSQVRACADALVGLAKTEGVTVILAGQVTKDGEMAGPRTLEHAVDVVCSFGGDPRTGLRVLSAGKNRFGPDGEVTWFDMGPDGLVEVEPSSLISPSDGEVGAATALLTAGRRVLPVEVQTLSVPTEGYPRRHVSGLDAMRFSLMAAVVDRAIGTPVARAELYGAAAGGLRIDDPSCDLAVAAALASTAGGLPPPPRSAFCGEVSLTGAIRPVTNIAGRLAAAAAAGIQTVYCAAELGSLPGVTIKPVRHLRVALEWARPKRKRPA